MSVESPHHVRWMVRKDMPRVLEIEQASREYAWTEEEFIRQLRTRNVIGMVATEGGDGSGGVVGFMVYALHKNHLHVLNMATWHEKRRQGAGTAMVDKLIGKLTPERRSRIVVEVEDTNVRGQTFLAHRGFRATSVQPEWFENGQDAYRFVYAIDGEPQKARNRFADIAH